MYSSRNSVIIFVLTIWDLATIPHCTWAKIHHAQPPCIPLTEEELRAITLQMSENRCLLNYLALTKQYCKHRFPGSFFYECVFVQLMLQSEMRQICNKLKQLCMESSKWPIVHHRKVLSAHHSTLNIGGLYSVCCGALTRGGKNPDPLLYQSNNTGCGFHCFLLIFAARKHQKTKDHPVFVNYKIVFMFYTNQSESIIQFQCVGQ